jgi:hypothetical protein
MESFTSISIFLSCGTPHNKAQEDFISAIEAHLESHGCNPQTIGRSKFSARQPAEASRDLIARCSGAVVVAFERTRILTGLDKPESSIEKKIANESHPTVWNHMEAAMAYARKVPILTIVQPGLKRQGMLSDRLEWMAIEAELSPEVLRTDYFRQVFAEWLSLVKQGMLTSAQPDFDPSEIKIGKLLSQLTTKQAWALAVVIFGVLAGLATVAFKAGQSFPITGKNSQQIIPAKHAHQTASATK